MFQRTLLTAMAVAAGALAAAALKTILEHKDDKKYDDDEEVRFIRISDDEEETAGYDASARSEQVQQICAVYPYLNPDFVEAKLAENEKPLSPGMKYRHYAPTAELVLIDAEDDDFLDFIASISEKNVGVISYSEYLRELKNKKPELVLFDFGQKCDEFEQAQRLFAILRETDKLSLDKIYAPLPKKEGIGLALYNRMIRAAAHKIIRMRR
jgi:L-threonylcarbamoyladenylate synthase